MNQALSNERRNSCNKAELYHIGWFIWNGAVMISELANYSNHYMR